jgi:hypothetical protein
VGGSVPVKDDYSSSQDVSCGYKGDGGGVEVEVVSCVNFSLCWVRLFSAT